MQFRWETDQDLVSICVLFVCADLALVTFLGPVTV